VLEEIERSLENVGAAAGVAEALQIFRRASSRGVLQADAPARLDRLKAELLFERLFGGRARAGVAERELALRMELVEARL
jgi:hypothetical protein